jgi:Helicase HerA, central domain
MAHCLILGMTESGKTTLAKRLCNAYRTKYQIETIVLDPMNDPEWNASFQTSDQEEFLAMVWSSESCAIFIDEGGKSIGKYNYVMEEVFTQGRHFGHSAHVCTQRGVQLAVTVRDQCAHLFLFTTAKKDSLIHANEWNCDALADASRLYRGEFFHTTRFGAVTLGRLFEVPHGTNTDTRNGNGTSEEEARSAQERADPSDVEPTSSDTGSADPESASSDTGATDGSASGG